MLFNANAHVNKFPLPFDTFEPHFVQLNVQFSNYK